MVDYTQLREEFVSHVEDELVRDTQMLERIATLSAQIKELEASIQSLLNLWEQARGMLTLVKWCSAIAGVGISIFTFIKTKL